MTLREEAVSLYIRLSDRGPCDECGSLLVHGEQGRLVILSLQFGHLVYSICDKCSKEGTPKIREEAERIRERLVSEGVIQILQPPETTVN